MGKYRDHRERRGRQAYEEAIAFSEQTSEPNYFQRSAAGSTEALDAEVLWFNDSKGFGFVKLGDGAEVYLHASVLDAAGGRNVSEGSKLKVTVEKTPRGRQIAQVLKIGEAVRKGSSRSQQAEEAGAASSTAGETEGTVKWYNPEKGFGFIAPRSGHKDVFVHATALSRSGLAMLTEGQKVLMECRQGKKGPEVHSIRLARV